MQDRVTQRLKDMSMILSLVRQYGIDQTLHKLPQELTPYYKMISPDLTNEQIILALESQLHQNQDELCIKQQVLLLEELTKRCQDAPYELNDQRFAAYGERLLQVYDACIKQANNTNDKQLWLRKTNQLARKVDHLRSQPYSDASRRLQHAQQILLQSLTTQLPLDVTNIVIGYFRESISLSTFKKITRSTSTKTANKNRADISRINYLMLALLDTNFANHIGGKDPAMLILHFLFSEKQLTLPQQTQQQIEAIEPTPADDKKLRHEVQAQISQKEMKILESSSPNKLRRSYLQYLQEAKKASNNDTRLIELIDSRISLHQSLLEQEVADNTHTCQNKNN